MFSELKNPSSREKSSLNLMGEVSRNIISKAEKCITFLDHLLNPFDKHQYFIHSKQRDYLLAAQSILDNLDIHEKLFGRNQSLGFTLLKALEFPGSDSSQRPVKSEFLKFFISPLQSIDVARLSPKFVDLSNSTHSKTKIPNFSTSQKCVSTNPDLPANPGKRLDLHQKESYNIKQFSVPMELETSVSHQFETEVLVVPEKHKHLNQEMIDRKKKKIMKLSKRRRRRWKKRNKKNTNDSESGTKPRKLDASQLHSQIVNSESSDSDYDSVDFCERESDQSGNYSFRTCKKELPLPNAQANTSSINVRFSGGQLGGNILVDFSSKNDVSAVNGICINPTVSFILGHTIETESEDDVDFDETGSSSSSAIADLEFSQFGNCFFTGFASLHISGMPQSLGSPLYEEISVNFCEFPDELRKINVKWNEMMSGLESTPRKPSKVSFAVDDKLTEVKIVEAYDCKGEWEIFALERIRFKQRITESERILSPVLMSEHRNKIYEKLHKD